jgi:hypothetical protein
MMKAAGVYPPPPPPEVYDRKACKGFRSAYCVHSLCYSLHLPPVDIDLQPPRPRCHLHKICSVHKPRALLHRRSLAPSFQQHHHHRVREPKIEQIRWQTRRLKRSRRRIRSTSSKCDNGDCAVVRCLCCATFICEEKGARTRSTDTVEAGEKNGTK